MASLIEGFTLHSFHKLTFKQKDGTTAAVHKEKKNEMDSKFLRYQALRFMFVDELSTVSVEVFADINHNTSTHIRERGTWSLRSRNVNRPFGGLNVVTSGDAWQFGPIGSSGAVFDNPLKMNKRSSSEQISAMFWTTEPDAFNCFLELTVERRCKDPWLSHVLRGVRHGRLDEESYCFLHGFPTQHPGSWDPKLQTVTCGSDACERLTEAWHEDLYLGRRGNAHWLRRRSQECDVCAAERKRRCRVLHSSDLSPMLQDDPRFAAAPYIHAYNEPKYHAAQIRALHFGMETRRVVMWFVAEDRPLTKNVGILQDASIDEQRQQWLAYHDMKTGGIMGMQPLVREMPLRITQTDHRRKDKRLFKNSRCVLRGWELHPVDQQRFENNTTQELVLQHMPICLYVHFPTATWVENEKLGKGVAKINPTYVVWALDKAWTQKIERHGFTIASDFSGTAHSFQGSTLGAAITDCNEWDVMPSRKDQLTGYMCLNRIETADALCIVQPFSPQLFQQGDLPGPNLFLKFCRKEITSQQAYVAWDKERNKKRNRITEWRQEMPIFCRGCSDATRVDTQKPLKDFPRASRARAFENVVAGGMERFCTACTKSRLGLIADTELDEPAPEVKGARTGGTDGTHSKFIDCTQCHAILREAAFDAKKLEAWRKDRNLARSAVCMACEAKPQPAQTKCTQCHAILREEAFDAKQLETWREYCHLARDAVCMACEAKPQPAQTKCTQCHAILREEAFDAKKLETWRQNYNLARDAVCMACEAKPQPAQTKCTQCHAILREEAFDAKKLETWRQNYNLARDAVCMACEAKPQPAQTKCTQCHAILREETFDAKKLETWRQNYNLARDAVCMACEARMEPKPVLCVRCEKVKPRHAYDEMMLERWTKHREITKKAECRACASARGVTTHEPKRVWKQPTYTCSICKDPHPPGDYDYKKLAALEEGGQVYLAVCIPCDSQGSSGEPVTCVGCGVKKQRNEFSFARRRCKNYKTWRCLECDLPPCEMCKDKPSVPKKAPYICEPCLYPPCKCGAERPRSTKYRSTNDGMKTWTCSKCKRPTIL